MYLCFLASPFTLFHPVPQPLSPLTSVSLFHVSMSLFLFCSSVYFAHQIPQITEIIWYLSFSVRLILLSEMISRSIHAVKKPSLTFWRGNLHAFQFLLMRPQQWKTKHKKRPRGLSCYVKFSVTAPAFGNDFSHSASLALPGTLVVFSQAGASESWILPLGTLHAFLPAPQGWKKGGNCQVLSRRVTLMQH